ncbi:MAG: hypothetical protein LBI05_04685 [Planctomycetaceae bacterium]|nr:hypothetical protein [Planctomycetaceae bacterium]
MPIFLSQESNRLGEFERVSKDARQLWHTLVEIPLENTVYRGDREDLEEKEAIQKIADLAKQIDSSGGPSQHTVNRFFQTVTTSLLKKRVSDAEDCFLYLDEEIVMGMEYFLLEQSLSNTRKRAEGWDLWGRWHQWNRMMSTILPISGKQGQSMYISKIRWARFPYDCPAGVPEVSNLFHDLGCYDKAWRASLESVYFNNSIPHLLDSRRSSDIVLSSKNAHYWHDAAESAYRAGDHDLAWGFLMKAAVFGTDELYATTLETAKLWLDVEAGLAELPQPEPLTPEERKVKFLEIVRAYKNMNAHPRAWAIIDEYKDEFEDPEGLKKEIQDDWLDLTNMLCSAASVSGERVIFYGYELVRIEDAADGTRTEIHPFQPLDVKIPWIYPSGWKEAAQKMFDEEMKKLDVSHDRFRTWHTDCGAVSFVAKFVSWIDDKVTLEKEDGTSITVALDDFMLGDQNFIRYCFEKVSTKQVPQTKQSPANNSSVLFPVFVTLAVVGVLAFFLFRRLG